MFANSHNLLKIVRSNLLILYFQAKQANFCEASKVISKCIYLQPERIFAVWNGSQKVLVQSQKRLLYNIVVIGVGNRLDGRWKWKRFLITNNPPSPVKIGEGMDWTGWTDRNRQSNTSKIFNMLRKNISKNPDHITHTTYIVRSLLVALKTGKKAHKFCAEFNKPKVQKK